MKRINNQKGFTLIELLAVIIILGILMVIAIPSVSKYINDSRKSTYVTTAKQLIAGVRNLVNDGKHELFDTNVTYYIDTSCIKTESGNQSPYGKFDPAYVVVTYTGRGFNYYWTSRDDTGHGIRRVVSQEHFDEDDIETDVLRDDIKTNLGIEDREYYRQGCSSYSFNINGVKLDNEYHWTLIIDATVKGERFTYYSVSSIGSKISFVNKSGISESDISIDGLYLVRGRKVDHTYDFLMYIGYFFVAVIGAAGVFGTVGGALFIAFMVLLIFVIVPGIVILIIKPWKKRDKKQE